MAATKKTYKEVSQVFEIMTRIWKSPELTKKTKINIYDTMLQPIFLYGSKCWTMRKQSEEKFLHELAAEYRRVTRLEKIRNDDNRRALSSQSTIIWTHRKNDSSSTSTQCATCKIPRKKKQRKTQTTMDTVDYK